MGSSMWCWRLICSHSGSFCNSNSILFTMSHFNHLKPFKPVIFPTNYKILLIFQTRTLWRLWRYRNFGHSWCRVWGKEQIVSWCHQSLVFVPWQILYFKYIHHSSFFFIARKYNYSCPFASTNYQRDMIIITRFNTSWNLRNLSSKLLFFVGLWQHVTLWLKSIVLNDLKFIIEIQCRVSGGWNYYLKKAYDKQSF